MRGERNAVANKMKGKLEPSERQILIEQGDFAIALTRFKANLFKTVTL